MVSALLLLSLLLFAILLTEQVTFDHKEHAEKIEAMLPQTQCGLCGYDGCTPYARAIVTRGEAIDKCATGGQETLDQLLRLTGYTPLAALNLNTPSEQIAIIDEAECIGCTKCITACPVDAIVGAQQQMHGIMTPYCTGCGLCLPPCPVDCITLLPTTR